MNASTSPDSTPDLSTQAGRESFINLLVSVMPSSIPGCEELVAHQELALEPGADQ
jgi:hypothetical protein